MERINSWDSSDNKNSLILSRHISHQIDDDDDVAAESENESVSEAGDTGDRVFHRTRSCESEGESGNLHFSSGCILENGVVISMPEDQKLQPCLSAAQSVTPGSNNREVGSKDIKVSSIYKSLSSIFLCESFELQIVCCLTLLPGT